MTTPDFSSKSPLPSDPYDMRVGDIAFVVHRERAAGWRQPDLKRRHHHTLALATAGRARYLCNNQPLEVQAGTLLLFPPGLQRSAEADAVDPWSFYSVAFVLKASHPTARQTLANLPLQVPVRDPAEAESLFSELIHLWTAAAPGYLLLCRSVLERLLFLTIRSQQRERVPHQRRLEQVAARLQSQYTCTFRSEELAEMAHLSESRFRVLFKQMTGCSVVQYQNRIRINRARGLLLSGEYTVTRVAELVGFSDVYYFSRLFKQMTGVNPSTLR